MTLIGGGPITAKRIFEAALSSSKSVLSKEGAGSFALCPQLLHPSVQNNKKMIGKSEKYEWSVF
jgi:hypothetical protein